MAGAAGPAWAWGAPLNLVFGATFRFPRTHLLPLLPIGMNARPHGSRRPRRSRTSIVQTVAQPVPATFQRDEERQRVRTVAERLNQAVGSDVHLTVTGWEQLAPDLGCPQGQINLVSISPTTVTAIPALRSVPSGGFRSVNCSWAHAERDARDVVNSRWRCGSHRLSEQLSHGFLVRCCRLVSSGVRNTRCD
jgi:hypothetical protein